MAHYVTPGSRPSLRVVPAVRRFLARLAPLVRSRPLGPCSRRYLACRALADPAEGPRPPRALCRADARPCPWTTCRQRMTPEAPADYEIPEPWCALDVAELVEAGGDPPPLAAVASWFGLSRARIHQVESDALRSWARELGIDAPRRVARDHVSVAEIRGDLLVRQLRAAGGSGGLTSQRLGAILGVGPKAVQHAVARLRRRGLRIASGVDGYRLVEDSSS